MTVGTHPAPFDALLATAARWAAAASHTFVVQAGPSRVVVPGAQRHDFLTPEAFASELARADLVLAHLGCGIAREVQEAGVPTLFMCRAASRGEHLDDHQSELQEALRDRPGLGFLAPEEDPEAAWMALGDSHPEPPQELDHLRQSLRDWLDA